MSTIETIQSSDSPSESIGDINQNFETLNDEKIEAESTEELKNKTIDADENDISNLDATHFKDSALSGDDPTLITGTAGDQGTIAVFDADGNLVGSLKSFVTEVTSDSTDLEIPTAEAVFELVDSQLSGAKEIFVPAVKTPDNIDYVGAIGNFPYAQLDSGEDAYFVFHVPSNFSEIVEVAVIMIPDATETVQADIDVNFAANGQSRTTHTTGIANTQLSVTADVVTKWPIDSLSTLLFANLEANDFVGIKFNSNTTMLRVLGLLFRYQ